MRTFFHYSQSAQKACFVATGEVLPEVGSVEYDPLELTPTQRELIYTVIGNRIRVGDRQFDYPCTIEDVLEYLEFKHQKDLERRDLEIRKALDRIEELERQDVDSIADTFFSYPSNRVNYDRVRRLLLEHSDLPSVGEDIELRLLKIDEKLKAGNSIFEQQIAERERQRAEDDEKLQQQKEFQQAQQHAERRDWIERYGDERLKLTEANGYKCQRLYAGARAKHEYPDFILDFDDEWGYKERVSPTLAALKQLEKYPGSTIVWIIKTPDDRYDEGTEAIVVANFLGKYDLFLPIEDEN